MECLNPIGLKSGLFVPCGKCALCQSRTRTEKSVLVQLNCDSYDRMPLFIGLSYDDDHLPLYCTCPTEERMDHAPMWSAARYYRKSDFLDHKSDCIVPSLFRKDVSSFLKSYKRINGLRNEQFQYFGCGEYGQDREHTNRPHYHLIWFGDTHLEELYDRSVHHAERWLAEFWQNGNVDIGVAEWRGIHYVTKYCMKEENSYPVGALPPFTISSNGIGLNWLNTYQAERIRQKLRYLYFNKDDIYSMVDLFQLDWTDRDQRIDLLKSWIDKLKPLMPDFTVTTGEYNKVILPRKLRTKLLGTYQHFGDNPYWLFTYLEELYRTEVYYRDNYFYDSVRGDNPSLCMQARQQHALTIQQRISRNKSKRL